MDNHDWVVAAQDALSEFFPERGLVQLTMDMVGYPAFTKVLFREDIEKLVLSPPFVKKFARPRDWVEFAYFCERYDLTRTEKQVILQTAREMVWRPRRAPGEIGQEDLMLAIKIYKDGRNASLEADRKPFQRARKIPIPKTNKRKQPSEPESE